MAAMSARSHSVHDAYPDKDIWLQCSGTIGSGFAGDLVWNTENLLIGATRNWARSVSLWNLALDENSGPTNGGCMGCRGVVTVDTRTVPATITRNVEYYSLGQLAKFALPGAREDRFEFLRCGWHRRRCVPESRWLDRAAGAVEPGVHGAEFSQSRGTTRACDYTLAAQSVAASL